MARFRNLSMQPVTRLAQNHLHYFDCPHHRRVTFQYKLQNSLSYIRDSITSASVPRARTHLFCLNPSPQRTRFVFCHLFHNWIVKKRRERERKRKRAPINIDIFDCTYVFSITDIRRMHSFNDQHEIFFHKFWILSYKKNYFLIFFFFKFYKYKCDEHPEWTEFHLNGHWIFKWQKIIIVQHKKIRNSIASQIKMDAKYA